MKTILFPTNFSMGCYLVGKYAAQLAVDVQSKIALLAAEAKASKVLAGDMFEQRGDSFERLSETRDMLASTYHVNCSLLEDTVSLSDTKKLGNYTDNYDLTVLGMHLDKDGSIVQSAGFDMIKTIQQSLAPLLIVPESIPYKKITKLIYAYDYKNEPEPPLATLHWLADWFNADLRFVSVLPTNISVQERDQIHMVQKNIGHQWKGDRKITFESIMYDNVPQCFKHYLNVWSPSDLLVLSINHQNIFKKLWHKSVIKSMLKEPQHPYLIIHR